MARTGSASGLGSPSTVGVDFGTATSLVAQRRGEGQPTEIWPLGRETTWVASVAGYLDGELVVGEQAEDLPAERVIRSVKRAITDGERTVVVGPSEASVPLAADDVIVAMLAEVVRRAGAALAGHPEVRLCCPAMWDGARRRRLLQLATKAGLPVSPASLVDEPVAAGMAWLTGWRARQPAPPSGRVLVFDMGGGTVDIAVLDVRGDRHSAVTVLAALGTDQAGDHLDGAIAADLGDQLRRRGLDLDALDERARRRLVLAARDAKVALSFDDRHAVVLPRRQFAVSSLWYTRNQLEEVFAAQMAQAELYLWAALRTARLAERLAGSTRDLRRLPTDELARDVDYVVLAGGMSRIPYVARRLRDLLPGASVIEAATPAPEEAVVIGLAQAPGYQQTNMFRPEFDVFVEWDDGREQRMVYEAYSPLYEPWQVFQGHGELCHQRTGRELALPSRAPGRLRVCSPTGRAVRATLAGRGLDGYEVGLDRDRFVFKIYCDGRIRMTDSAGDHEGRVDGWAPIRGRDDDERVRRAFPDLPPDPPVYYPFDRDRN